MVNGFRLISLYVGGFGCLKKQVFNFCSDYVTTVVEDNDNKLQLKVEHKPVLPSNFFALNEESGGSVCSVSAIIGKNGSGKTSIAKFLHQILSGNTEICDFAITFRIDDVTLESYCRSDGELDIRCDDQKVKIERYPLFGAGIQNTNCKKLRDRIRMIYYSPVYSSQHSESFVSTDCFRDLSTTAALRYSTSELLNSDTMTYSNEVSLSLVEANDTAKALIVAELLSHYTDQLKDIGLPVPVRVRIQCEPRLISGIKSLFERKAKVFESCLGRCLGDVFNKFRGENSAIKPVGLIDIVNITLETNKEGKYQFSDFIVCSFFMFVFSQCAGGKNAPSPSLLFGLCEIAFNLFYRIRFADGNGYGQGDYHSYIVENLRALSTKYTSEACVVAACTVFESLCGLHEEGNGVYCSLEGRLSPVLCSIIIGHAKSSVKFPYLTFSFDPHLSSGEMSVLTLLGRLKYDYDGVLKNTMASRCELVFLDEIETTMHPDLQRKLVWLLIWFYESILVDVHPHLIFATHSPILLSDIPHGNVVRLALPKYENKGESEGCNGEVCQQETFAAHIFNLYKESFFLNEGTIGEFAKGKVDQLLKKLNLPKPNVSKMTDEERKKAEEEYQQKLQEIKDDHDDVLKVASLIGDPFLSRYIWRRLEELSDNADILEDEFTVSDETKEIIELKKKQDEEMKNKEAKKGGSEQ